MMKTPATIILATLAASASAQTAPHPQGGGMAMPAPHACPVPPRPLPAGYAGWDAPAPVTAATTPRELAIAALLPGRGARATLAPFERLSFPVAPAHAAVAGSYGGLFALAVTQAGTYRVALDGAPWIDMVRDGQAVASVAHAPGPDCSGIRKTVDFALAPGRYVLQLSGAKTPALRVLVAPIN